MFPRHATDVISLVAGIIFTGFTTIWILTLAGSLDLGQAWIGGPVIMVAAGAAGLAAALRPPAARSGRPDTELAEPAEDSQAADLPD